MFSTTEKKDFKLIKSNTSSMCAGTFMKRMSPPDSLMSDTLPRKIPIPALLMKSVFEKSITILFVFFSHKLLKYDSRIGAAAASMLPNRRIIATP